MNANKKPSEVDAFSCQMRGMKGALTAAREIAGRLLEREVSAGGELSAQDLADLVGMRLGPLATRYIPHRLAVPQQRALTARLLWSQGLQGRARATLGQLTRLFIDVPYVVLKGLPVAWWLYHPPELRESVDVDLVIRKPDYRTVERLLRGAGFRPDRPDPTGLEVTFVAEDRRFVPIDVHLDLWVSKPSLEEVLRDAVTVECGGLVVPAPGHEHQVQLLAGHWLRDLGDCALRLLDVLLAMRATGIEIADEATRRLVLRDAARWFGVGPSGGKLVGPWRFVDHYLERVDPVARPGLVLSPEARILRLLVAWLQRPTRGLARTLLALSPATAHSGSWNENRPGWQRWRLAAFVRELVVKR